MMKALPRYWKHAAALAAAGGIALCIVLWARPHAAVEEVAVASRPLAIVLRERGILQGRGLVPVEARTHGEIVELADNGAPVKKGDVVLRQDTEDLAEQLEEILVNIANAEVEKDLNQAELALAEREEANRIKRLEADLERAKRQLKTAEDGLADEDRRLLVIDREVAALDLEDAEGELERQQRLLAKEFISESMLEPFVQRARTARARLEEMKARIVLREKAVPEERRVELAREVRRIEGLLARRADARKRRVELIQAKLGVSDARIAEARYRMRRLERGLKQTESAAPASGIFSIRLFRDWRGGGVWTEYKPGLRVYRQDIVADIVDPHAMSVAFLVHESDFRHLAEGLPARVRLPAFPDRVFEGSLKEVGGIGRDRFDLAPQGQEESHTGVTVFNALLDIESPGVELRPGMSALVEVVIEPEKPRLVLPRAAVQRTVGDDEARFVVRQKALVGIREITVTGRMVGDTLFEVQSGLQEGDVVVVGREEDAS